MIGLSAGFCCPSLTRSLTCRLSSPLLRVPGHPPLTRSFTCRLSSPLFQSMATHRLRVPSLVDYRRHSSKAWPPTAYAFPHLSTIVATPSSSWPPSAYAFLHLSTIVATLRVRSVPLRLRVPSLVDYRRHSSKAWPPTAYAFPHLSTIVATLRVRSVPLRLRVPSLVDYRRHSFEFVQSPQDPLMLSFYDLNKIEDPCNLFTHLYYSIPLLRSCFSNPKRPHLSVQSFQNHFRNIKSSMVSLIKPLFHISNDERITYSSSLLKRFLINNYHFLCIDKITGFQSIVQNTRIRI